jgi:hypothetical protein
MLRKRLTASFIVLASLASAALLAASMRAYPGGTQWDHAAQGNDFWRNYLCDLARTVALDGRANPAGSTLAQASMAMLATALFVFFWIAPLLFPTRARLATWVRVLGSSAIAASFAVVLLPADRYPEVHGAAIVVAGVPGVASALLTTIGLRVGGETRALTIGAAWAGALAFVVSLLALLLYLRQFVVPGPGPVAGAILERLSLLLVLAWILFVALVTLANGSPRASRRPDGSSV